jgi:endo-1,4-beta-xylanase
MTHFTLGLGARGCRAARRYCARIALCISMGGAAPACEGDDEGALDDAGNGAVSAFPDAGRDAATTTGAGGNMFDAALVDANVQGMPSTFDAAVVDAGAQGAPDARARLDAFVPSDAFSAPDARGPGPADGGPVRDAAPPREGGAPQPDRKFVGNITTRNQVRADFVDYWDQITPENEGKWQSVEGTRDRMVWDGLDRAYNYARQHGLVFKQHTLVWGSQQPTWLAGLPAAEQRAEVEEWIRLFCERYPDTELIDVVNEPPPHTTPPYLAALGGAGQSGYDWIVQAFRWTRQYCPNAKLILNDYNNIEYGADNMRFIAIVNALKAAGAPIDALGAQAHDAFKLPNATVQMFIDRLAATGLPVYISEYDIDLADDARQQQIMQSQFTMFWNHPAVRGITLWGYVSGATWRPNTGLMSSTGAERPALRWLREFLQR